MDIVKFLIWLLVIGSILAFAIGAMLEAYVGSGSVAVLFTEPIPVPENLPETGEQDKDARNYFQQGCVAFEKGKYRQAVGEFRQALQARENFPEAIHNLGLAYANLRQDDDAVASLVKASELYTQLEQQQALTTIKENLAALRKRKLAREQA